MRRAAVVLVVMWAASALAAEATRVASSLEENDPFGMFLDFTFDRIQDRGGLVREWYQRGTNEDVGELRYQLYRTALDLDLHLGLYRDVELHVGVPIVFQEDRSWAFSQGTNENVSTIYRNCPNARGEICANPGAGDGRLFEIGDPAAGTATGSYRGGLGDLTFGLAWAPLSQRKDDTKPTWVLRFDYTAPTATLLDPSRPTTLSARGNIGDRVHRYTWSTAVSKRLSIVEPYFELHYTLPWRGPGHYSNCDRPLNQNMARAENCGRDVWSREETAIRPVHTGGVYFGTEVTLFERPERHQRFVIDARAFATYVSEGRVYNELSDLLGKLLYSSDYATLGGHLGFIGQAADFITLRGIASWGYSTEHFLTNENVGRDFVAPKNGTVDVTTHPEEINPNFDFRVDHQGRRFRMQEQFTFRILVSASFNF